MSVLAAEMAIEAFGVSRESVDRLQIYIDVLSSWQKRINLVGSSTLEVIWSRHIVDSVQLLPLLPATTRKIADLGTGAGIPGLIVAIAGGYESHLYESNSKKVAFLRQAIRATGATATVHQIRLEDIAERNLAIQVDVVLSRALAPLNLLLGYAEPFMRSGSRALFHKGQDIDIELTEATKYWNMSYIKHPSVSDSRGVILEMKEAVRVRGQ